ncbi:MAG: hypothetical protein B6244_04360 [Candidatus Cloacimonetes bacterium 4572_55]|nr:MAG: hypothetical protein B6244_04360 [Candidatus Cloacimonetes bacterium 4572_55]
MKNIFILTPLCILFITSAAHAQTYTGIYDPDDWRTVTNHSYVTVIASEINYVYFATTGGILIYDEIKEEWRDFWLPKQIVRIGVGPFRLYLEIRPEHIDVGELPYIQFDKKNFEWKYDYKPASYEEITWFGGDYDVTRLENQFPFVHDIDFMDKYLRHNRIISWQTDHFGEFLWIGSDGGGLYKYEINTGWFEKIRFGLLDPHVSSILKSGGIFWFGGVGEKREDYRGVTIYDPGQESYRYMETRYIKKFPTATVRDIAESRYDVWLATPQGLVRFNKERHGWQSFDTFSGLSGDDVVSVATTKDYVWVGLRTGLDWMRVDKKGEVKERGEVPHKLSYLTINDLESHEDMVVAATGDGAFSYTLGDTGWVMLDAGALPLVGQIDQVCIDKDHIYFAVEEGVIDYDRSLEKWDMHYFFTNIPETGSRNPPCIRAIAADRFNLWLGTDNGIWRLNKKRGLWHKYLPLPAQNKSSLVSSVTLPDKTINDIAIDGNYIWFATKFGVTRFYWNDPNRTW